MVLSLRYFQLNVIIVIITGTGACAIYPLLAAVKNKWNFVGTESDTESFTKAEENVQKNSLQEFIKCVYCRNL